MFQYREPFRKDERFFIKLNNLLEKVVKDGGAVWVIWQMRC